MTKATVKSAGVLLFRVRDEQLEVFIGHMGGPFWAKKDERGWSIPKGEYEPDEDPLAAAKREFAEEVGSPLPEGPLLELGEYRQPSGKRIIAWAVEGDFDPAQLKSNTFKMEWPPKSGHEAEFPEFDRAHWFDAHTAEKKLVLGQVPFLEELEQELRAAGRELRSRDEYTPSPAPEADAEQTTNPPNLQRALF